MRYVKRKLSEKRIFSASGFPSPQVQIQKPLLRLPDAGAMVLSPSHQASSMGGVKVLEGRASDRTLGASVDSPSPPWRTESQRGPAFAQPETVWTKRASSAGYVGGGASVDSPSPPWRTESQRGPAFAQPETVWTKRASSAGYVGGGVSKGAPVSPFHSSLAPSQGGPGSPLEGPVPPRPVLPRDRFITGPQERHVRWSNPAGAAQVPPVSLPHFSSLLSANAKMHVAKIRRA
jgi:hypothetical protein